MTTEPMTRYPEAHHVTVPFRTIYPDGRSTTGDGGHADRDDPQERQVQQVRTIIIDDKALCLPLDGTLMIEPMVGAAGHRVTVEFFADSVLFEPNPDL